jgi:hypothetical protein
MREDIDSISKILCRTFEVPVIRRDYDSAFGAIADILRRYGLNENARNVTLRFILCMQEFFDATAREMENKRSRFS